MLSRKIKIDTRIDKSVDPYDTGFVDCTFIINSKKEMPVKNLTHEEFACLQALLSKGSVGLSLENVEVEGTMFEV